jgi:hypothetical protein
VARPPRPTSPPTRLPSPPCAPNASAVTRHTFAGTVNVCSPSVKERSAWSAGRRPARPRSGQVTRPPAGSRSPPPGTDNASSPPPPGY